MLKAIKIRIYPSLEQIAFLNRQFGAIRMVYNKGLAIIGHQYKIHKKSLSPSKNIKPLLSIAKKSRKYAWLKDYDSIALQQACRNLDSAFGNFFQKRAGYPRFKKRHGEQSSYHCTGISFGDNWIKIPKLRSKIKAKQHRFFEGELKSITLSRNSTGKYFASLLINLAQDAPKPLLQLSADKILGIDLGITHLLSDSKGRLEENPRFLQRAANNLRRKQKAFNRKTKGSQKRKKARLLVAKCHEKISNSRNDFQHKLTRRLIDENQAVVVESLKIKNMLKNRSLSKAISDAAWQQLVEKFQYKAQESGKHLVKIDTWFPSSKTCSICEHKIESLTLNVREWSCPSCKALHHRDLNAALNIKAQGILKLKAEGLSVSANGGLHKTDNTSAVA